MILVTLTYFVSSILRKVHLYHHIMGVLVLIYRSVLLHKRFNLYIRILIFDFMQGVSENNILCYGNSLVLLIAGHQNC